MWIRTLALTLEPDPTQGPQIDLRHPEHLLGPAPHGPSEPLSGRGPVMRSGLCRPAGGRTAPERPGFLGSRAPRRPAGAPHIDPRGAGTACAGETAGGVQVCAQSAHPRSSGAVGDHGPERAVAWSCVAHHPPSQGTPCPDPGPTRGWTGQGTPVSPAGLQADPRESCCHPGPLDSPRVPRSCQDGRKQKSGRGHRGREGQHPEPGGAGPHVWKAVRSEQGPRPDPSPGCSSFLPCDRGPASSRLDDTAGPAVGVSQRSWGLQYQAPTRTHCELTVRVALHGALGDSRFT